MVFENVFKNVTLSGQIIRIEPLKVEHVKGLFAAGNDPEIWRYLNSPAPTCEADMRRIVDEAIQGYQNRLEVPFTIVRQSDSVVLGSTRLYDIKLNDRALEVGWTWLGSAAQRTAANTEAKYLLLRFAFETLGALRVQLKTDERNLRSQKAIERIGAVREGTLRKHRVNWDGFVRNSVFFSITDDEWPAVEKQLLEFLK